MLEGRRGVVTIAGVGKLLVPNDLWNRIEPLLPRHAPKPQGGRPRTPDRVALTGILFVLKTGIPWEYLPQELGCSGMTCWRRLRDWQQVGLWERLHRVLLDELGQADKIDWKRASLDATLVPAKRGARRPAPTRRIVGDWAASTTCSSIAKEFRSSLR